MNPYRSVTPDSRRARNLVEQAQETLCAYASVNEDEFPSQTFKQYYEVLHAYLNALALLDGIKTRGEGAHHDLIQHAKANNRITEEEKVVLEQLRKKRNALIYDGKAITKKFLQAKKQAILTLLEKLEDQLRDVLSEA